MDKMLLWSRATKVISDKFHQGATNHNNWFGDLCRHNMVDFKQSGSFSSDLGEGDCMRERASSGARSEGGSPRRKYSCLQSHAWSFSCLARFARRAKKKERLLVVSTIETKKGWPNFFPSFNPLPSIKTDDRKKFQCLTMVLNNNTGPLFLEFNWYEKRFSFLKS